MAKGWVPAEAWLLHPMCGRGVGSPEADSMLMSALTL